jgi:hypothetical protein
MPWQQWLVIILIAFSIGILIGIKVGKQRRGEDE